MRTISIIRDRGQLTIPDSIRKLARWTSTSSVVSISIESPQEIVITPHQTVKEVEFTKLFELIKQSREVKGKGTAGASEFIAKDRKSQ